jgi:ABC-2 type transport system ATP-binding protein
MIELSRLTKRFGEKIAVDDLSLSISKGEIFCFLGPNGAGKTTTIKMMAGLLNPSAGSVRIGGFDIAKNPIEAKRLLGYVPDQPYLYDKLTGWEFLEFVGRMYRVEETERRRKIEASAAWFDMTDDLHQLVEGYSHGMKQKTAIAAAFLHDPEVFVIDEPLVGLDPKSAKRFKDLLRQKAAGGTTVFMSIHTLPVAEELATRIGIIHRGELIAIGSVKEILARGGKDLEAAFLEMTG